MDQRQPLPTINCSHLKQAKKATAISVFLLLFKCYVYVCLQKYSRDFLSEMSAFQLQIC